LTVREGLRNETRRDEKNDGTKNDRQLSGLETRRDETRRDEKNDGTIEWFRNEMRRDETRRDEMEQLGGLGTRRDEKNDKTI
jgi:hypothetical protein